MVDGVQHQSYLKGETTDLKQFYTMMREGKVITTSLPNLSNSEKLLTDILKSGKDILYLGFSSGLSGTYNSIETLSHDLRTRFPERTIECIDTLAASMGRRPSRVLCCKNEARGRFFGRSCRVGTRKKIKVSSLVHRR